MGFHMHDTDACSQLAKISLRLPLQISFPLPSAAFLGEQLWIFETKNKKGLTHRREMLPLCVPLSNPPGL